SALKTLEELRHREPRRGSLEPVVDDVTVLDPGRVVDKLWDILELRRLDGIEQSVEGVVAACGEEDIAVARGIGTVRDVAAESRAQARRNRPAGSDTHEGGSHPGQSGLEQ